MAKSMGDGESAPDPAAGDDDPCRSPSATELDDGFDDGTDDDLPDETDGGGAPPAGYGGRGVGQASLFG